MSKDLKSPEHLAGDELQMTRHFSATLDPDVDYAHQVLLNAYPELRIPEYKPQADIEPKEQLSERFKDVPVVRTVIATADREVERIEDERQKVIDEARKIVEEARHVRAE